MKKTEKEVKTINPLHSLLILVAIYLVVQGIALSVGIKLIPKITTEPIPGPGQIPSAVPNPEAPETSGEIFIYILLITAIFILLLKFKMGFFIKIMMFVAMLMGMSITLWALFPDYWLYLVVLLYAVFLFRRDNIIVSNVMLTLTIAGIGAYLGASLHFIPAMLLLLILSIYDIIAVFGTKHMVILAKEAKGSIPMFSIPVKKKFLGMGTGDLAIPSMFAVSVLNSFSLNHSVLAITGGLLGLISLFFYTLKKEKVTLPALPPITIGLFIGFVVGFFLL